MQANFFERQFPSGQRVEIVIGDITQQKVDAIVNAANSHLAHGGGVAAAIVRRGGLVIQLESDTWIRDHGPVSHDKPAFTTAGNLPCKFVIHAVGPIWGEGDEDPKLDAAIRGSLELAENLNIHSIAFPAISTGIFGFPIERAAGIFFDVIASYLAAYPNSQLNLIRIVLLDKSACQTFIQAFTIH